MLKYETRSDPTLHFYSIHQFYGVSRFLSSITIIYTIYLFSQVHNVNEELFSFAFFR